MTPLVSFIIPTFNRKPMIANAINSVLNQTYQDIEIVVIDDGSSDGTLNYLTSKYKNKKSVKLYYQENAGISAARNRGFELSLGHYITFLDSDDYVSQHHTETLLELLKANPHVALAASNYVNLYKNDHREQLIPTAARFKDATDENIYIRVLERGLSQCGSILIKRKAIEHVGGFDESLEVFEDRDFWLRVLLKYKVTFIDKALLFRTVHKDCISEDKLRWYSNNELLLKKHLNLSPQFTKEIRRLLLDSAINLARSLRQNGHFSEARRKLILSFINYPSLRLIKSIIVNDIKNLTSCFHSPT